MAVFGFHIVLTMITATFAHKFLPRIAPCSQMLATWLQRYAMPPKTAEEEIKQGGGFRQQKARRRANAPNSNNQQQSDSDVLYRVPVTIADLSNIAFTTDMELVFDFAFASIVVLSIADIRAFFFPCEAENETNLSLVWSWIAIGLGVRALFITLRIFMKESSFTSVCLMSGCIFALFSMVLLSFPDNLVDLRLKECHQSIETALAIAFNQTIDSPAEDYSPPQLNFNLFRGFLALSAGIFGTLLTFPGLRFVKLYSATIAKEYENTQSFKDMIFFYAVRGLLHAALMAPLLLCLLWLKPVTDAIFPSNFDEHLYTIRTFTMLVTSCVHLAVALPLIQTHLDSAERRVSHSLAKHNTMNPGRPAEKPVDLRREVNIPSQSLGIVCVQIMTPPLMMMLIAFSFKALLGASWIPVPIRRNCVNGTQSASNASHALTGTELVTHLLSKISSDEGVSNLANDFAASFSRFRIAAGSSAALWQATIGFAVFWMCVVQLLTSIFGIWHARGSASDPEQTLF